jgi:hypothetical protein
LNGKDVSDSPIHSASRWVINFFDWPMEKARSYGDCFSIVEAKVKPERARNKRKTRRERWWLYAESAPALYRAVSTLERVLVTTQVSKTQQPTFVTPGQVYDQRLVVFSYSDFFHFGVLSGAFHWHWIVTRGSTLETRPVYTPRDVFETFPQPLFRDDVAAAGKALHEHRATLMVKNDEGLTKTYNRVHNAADTSPGIVTLRELHGQLDHAVRDAYGWLDLDLDHGFHETSQGVRFTIGPAARTEVLDRLLEMNHARYADEVARGLHGKKKTAKKPRGGSGGMKKATGQATLFGARTGGKA